MNIGDKMDFDFDLDLDFSFDDDKIDDEFVLNTKTKKRIFFDLERSFELLKKSLELPTIDEEIRLISPAGGWSSCSLIMFIADKEVIEELTITTLRVGVKEMQALIDLYDEDRIKYIHIIMSKVAKANKIYVYHNQIRSIIGDRNVKVSYINNHSKVILAKTKDNYYVIETSSNLNENPKIEQFIICNDKAIYEYYLKVFKKLNVI